VARKVEGRDTVVVGAGTALVAIGVAALVALATLDWTMSSPIFDEQVWFWPLVLVSTLSLGAGLYLLLAPFVGLPVPRPKAEASWPFRHHSGPAEADGSAKVDALPTGSPHPVAPEPGQGEPEQEARTALHLEIGEPYLTARLVQTAGNRPTAVKLENVGKGAALNCLYAAIVDDPIGLKAWYLVGPLNLRSGERSEQALAAPHGVQQGTIRASDDTSIESGVRVPRIFDVFVRAFDGGPRDPESVPSGVALLGLDFPPSELFHQPQGPSGRVDNREEVLVCSCINGHIHRTLPHLGTAPQQFASDDSTNTWLSWYLRVSKSGLAPPVIATKPDARRVGTEHLPSQ
jgi:hypothetical protein